MMGKQSLLQQQRRAGVWRRGAVGLCLALLLAACDRPPSGATTAEIDDPIFRRGQKRLSTNKVAALEDFQKVIDKRGGDAPESHFEAGRIYFDHFKDYVTAIYHFRRYRDLKPNGNYAAQVKQMIETAEKEYTRTLVGNPREAENDRLDLLEKIEEQKVVINTLTAENERLKRTSRDPGSAAYPSSPTGATRTNAGGTAATAPNVTPAPTPTTGWADAVPNTSPALDVVPVVPEPAAGATTAASAQVGSGRVYIVVKGDTLVAISRKVYGSASHWKAIYEANRDRIPDPNVLKSGIELRLP
jgi:nucleoid-associated protein YgaU